MEDIFPIHFLIEKQTKKDPRIYALMSGYPF